ncbi:site-2 protease family protein [Promethearchaeum syntrophicum]|uniref:Site-2 protease family protein n=1 Tax=Promethearchaeum syntrophicum TaxID=2594042 RepID=A0A5B9D6R1_9ARCH|nr:site-2 protease family protein [Candidatus Prometheoarchaeum syntrophicum]QEE14838.1 Peptidase family M50 [Candidatus Prometheoarchaeum syntrophicum]
MTFVEVLLGFITEPIFIISCIFWILTLILIKVLGKKKENVTLFFPFLVLFKSKIFNRFFKKISGKGRRLWKLWWNIGIIVSFLLMIYAIYFFISNFFALIFNPQPENALTPIIPGVTISFPIFSYFILPILFAMTIHEFSHAIAAEIDGVSVKSSGIFGAGIFLIVGFGAFVEVDEFQLYSKNYSIGTRLRVASAGIWSNIVIAGIFFLLLLGFPTIMNVGYHSEGFQVSYVLPYDEGGFNENNLEIGDIVYKINDIVVDNNNNANLNDILMNKTDLSCSIGDQLEFKCINGTTGEEYIRDVTLGFNSFVGFDWVRLNNTAINITNVYSWLRAGNNYNLDLKGKIIVKINETLINYQNNQTFEVFLTQNKPSYKLNITSDVGETYEISVDFYSNIPGAHLLNDIFLGLNIEKNSVNSVNITEVFKNASESGINEGRIPENTIITKINGIQILLSNQSFKEFFTEKFSLKPGETLIFTDGNENNYTLITSEKPIVPVLIGIGTISYWVPSNWLGRLIGGLFPYEINIFVSFTFMISLSLALFNLLPISIFDGGRMMKELLHIVIGTKNIDKEAKKKLLYEFDIENSKQHLFTHSINEVIRVRELIPLDAIIINGNESNNYGEIETKNGKSFKGRDLLYKTHDTSNDGFIDTVEINEDQNIETKRLIEVEIEYEQDLKEIPKKRIYRIISSIMGVVIIASFIISLIKFGTSIFWF